MTDVLLPSAKQSTSQESWLSLQVAAPKVASVLKQEAEHCTRLTPLDLWLFARLWLQCFMLIQLLHLNCSSPALAGASHMQTKAKAPPSPPPPETLTVPKLRHQKAVLLKALDAGQVTPFLLTGGQSFFPSFGLPEDLVTVIYVQYPSI